MADLQKLVVIWLEGLKTYFWESLEKKNRECAYFVQGCFGIAWDIIVDTKNGDMINSHQLL